MRKYESALLFGTLLFLLIAGSVRAEYWFQSGARGDLGSSFNSGASVQIQTIVPQAVDSGSMAFWVGENLQNDAFIQVGYVLENQTGYYPTNCTQLGCTGRTLLNAGDAEWFYEYFLPGDSSTFLGSIGPTGSAGANGSFNTYSFRSIGNTWYFFLNNRSIGSANLGTSSSGSQFPVAVGEVANTSSARTHMEKVIFANLSAYVQGGFLPVSTGYGVINYGSGSRTDIPNPYGVQEIGNRVNYFSVGSGLPLSTENIQLWSLGYKLRIVSKYGNLSSGNTYVAYSKVKISAPRVVYLNGTAMAVFKGWYGTGAGSYTGSLNNVSITLNEDITETANCQLQYFVNVTSKYGDALGTGWYTNGSIATYRLNQGVVYENGTLKFRFLNWSNGDKMLSGSVSVNAPMKISAVWQYGITLVGRDAYDQKIDVSHFVLNGQESNSTPFLNMTGNYSLEGAYYKGVLMPLDLGISQNSMTAFDIYLPVYRVYIKTIDLFATPVNASVTIEYKNGTQATMFSGSKGLVIVEDVPYGYASVTLDYFGIRETATLANGTQFTAFFVSPINVIALVVAFSTIAYTVIRHLKKARAAV